MKALILFALMLFSCSAYAQKSFYSLETGKTSNVVYKTPYLGLTYGVTIEDFYTLETGLKTNFNEYYTLAYTAAGIQTKGKLYLAANAGFGWTFSIPQLDRRYDPATGETKILSAGYESKSIFALQATGRAGYQVLKGVKVYATYTLSFKNWTGIGIILH